MTDTATEFESAIAECMAHIEEVVRAHDNNLGLIAVKTTEGEDAEGQDAVFVLVQLKEPPRDHGWPVDEITDLRFAIQDAANHTACPMRVYMQLAVA